MTFILQQMLFFSMPLLVVAVGGLFSEKSGIVNIALEGLMIFGAFTGILFLFLTTGSMSGQWALIIAMGVAAFSGALLALMHAYASITMKANQAISGMALNILAPAIAIFVAKEVTPSELIPFKQKFFIPSIPILSDIPLIGPVFFTNVYITTYIAIIVFVIGLIVITKTKFGLHIRASGEHPHALDAAGVNVQKVRYFSVLISGALAGLGGIIFFIPTSVEFGANVSGYGFLAIAVLVFSKWNIKNIIFTSIFFGLMQTIASTYRQIDLLNSIDFIPSEFYKMLPYVATLIILSFSRGESAAPSAIGTPYEVSTR
jgi:simple sugar transport system permease protein